MIDKKEHIKIETTGKVNWNNDGFGIRITSIKPKIDFYIPKKYEDRLYKGMKFKILIEEV